MDNHKTLYNYKTSHQQCVYIYIYNKYYCCRFITKSCPTLCGPMDCRPPGSSVRGISQARILEWVAISFFRGSSWSRNRTHISYVSCIGKVDSLQQCHLGSPINTVCCVLNHVQLSATPWTVAHQAHLSIGILQAGILGWVAKPSSRGSFWPRDRTQGFHLADRFFTIWAPGKVNKNYNLY